MLGYARVKVMEELPPTEPTDPQASSGPEDIQPAQAPTTSSYGINLPFERGDTVIEKIAPGDVTTMRFSETNGRQITNHNSGDVQRLLHQVLADPRQHGIYKAQSHRGGALPLTFRTATATETADRSHATTCGGRVAPPRIGSSSTTSCFQNLCRTAADDGEMPY